MSYFAGGILRRGFRKTLNASAAETSSTTHAVVHTKTYGVVEVTVDVTAASGTSPTLVVVVEGSGNGTDWFELGRIGSNGFRVGSVGTAPADLTGVDTERGAFPAPQHVRTRSVIGGTSPSFTYSVAADIS